MNEVCLSRRSFLKSSATGVIGASVIGIPTTTLAWSNGMVINPQIPNTKVVCCYDSNMITNQSTANTAKTMTAQHNVCNVAQIEADMDAMVKELAGKTDVVAAWEAVFRKPSVKQWNQVKVAIKVNCIEPKNMPRIAIVGKVCKVMINLGVSASNITVYDACDDASGDDKYTPFTGGKGLPAGVVVQSGRGATANVTVGTGSMSCATVVTGADILVNCAVNKGHVQTDKGGFTLSMKNHTGTMKFSCPSLTEMINQSKSEAIIGGEVPRQQLCIVDSIWAMKDGPTSSGGPTHLPCRIAMGTFGPAVDIAVVKNIREPVLTATHNESAISTILSSFGLTANGLQWVVVPAVSTLGRSVEHNGVAPVFQLSILAGHVTPLKVHFSIPSGSTISKIQILTLHGRQLREFNSIGSKSSHVWDGTSDQGTRVTPGLYVAKVFAGSQFEAKPFHLIAR